MLKNITTIMLKTRSRKSYSKKSRRGGRKKATVRRNRTRRSNRMLIVPNGQPRKAYVGFTIRNVAYMNVAAATVDARILQSSIRAFRTAGGVTEAMEPQGWDVWRAMYGKFRIMGMKVIITYTGQGGSPLSIESYWSKDLTGISALGVADNKYTKYAVVGANTSRVTHKFYMRPWIIKGQSKRQWVCSEDSLGICGTLSPPVAPTNPTDMVYLVTNVRNLTGTASYIFRTIWIKFYVELSDPVILVDA